MEILISNKYRITNIIRLSSATDIGFEDRDIKEGLAIEKKCFIDGKDPSYYVICFVKYNRHDCSAELEDVGMRLLDVDDEDWKLFKKALTTAKEIVELANIGEE